MYVITAKVVNGATAKLTSGISAACPSCATGTLKINVATETNTAPTELKANRIRVMNDSTRGGTGISCVHTRARTSAAGRRSSWLYCSAGQVGTITSVVASASAEANPNFPSPGSEPRSRQSTTNVEIRATSVTTRARAGGSNHCAGALMSG